jgi:alcohol dehydrogenase
VGPLVKGDLRTIYLDDLTLNGATHPPHEDFAGLVTLINNGAIHPVVSQTHKMQDISRAQSDLIAGRFPGKLVLIPKETHP